MICSAKIQTENMKMTWNISLFSLGMIATFFLMRWLYNFVNNIKQCGIMFITSSLQS